MEGVAWVFVGAAAVATLVALLVFLVPLARTSGTKAPPARRAEASPSSSVGSLARGFSYLHVSPRTSVRRAGVHDRLQRAFGRIDAVDPHEAPRRIGEALLQAGLADTPSPPSPTDPTSTLPDRATHRAAAHRREQP